MVYPATQTDNNATPYHCTSVQHPALPCGSCRPPKWFFQHNKFPAFNCALEEKYWVSGGLGGGGGAPQGGVFQYFPGEGEGVQHYFCPITILSRLCPWALSTPHPQPKQPLQHQAHHTSALAIIHFWASRWHQETQDGYCSLSCCSHMSCGSENFLLGFAYSTMSCAVNLPWQASTPRLTLVLAREGRVEASALNAKKTTR